MYNFPLVNFHLVSIMNFLCCLKPTTKKKHATNKNKKDCVRNYDGEENNDEQSRNAIAVAVATAAAADVAIVAAQSALRSVARLASTKKDFSFNFQIKYWAAVKIQSAFRAHLARKAFKALKGLVKLQAMVKGSLVRKKTALTFQSMQALFRAQSRLKSEGSPLLLYNNNNVISQPSLYHRRSLENDQRTSTIDVDTCSMSFSTSLPKIRVSDHYDYVSRRRNIHRGRVSMSTNNTPKYVSCSENSSLYHPNYMTNTRSFEAKVRSFSTPKQRPEFCEGVLMKRRVSLNEEVHSRESLSGSSLKGDVVERLDKSLELTRVGFGSNYRYKNRTEVSCE